MYKDIYLVKSIMRRSFIHFTFFYQLLLSTIYMLLIMYTYMSFLDIIKALTYIENSLSKYVISITKKTIFTINKEKEVHMLL